jgi:phage minor structural protein, N-terminal domain protein|nr:MAG TPA: Neck appendage protein [Caudoviricetes sp.]DAS64550.1 MAG TPA: Neck appendage protein [Caudoviricetes sp.]
MIYLQEGNFPLNEAFSSEIVQEANSTYQLTFKFPTSDPKWALLTPETELVADDLHGEQYFSIFEVEKQHGYVTVYANQVATLLNGYSINKINVDRVNGATVMNALVAGFKRETPFTFFSDVMSKHTLNLKDISAMEALAKDKHSIVGQWGGDLVRDKYSVRLLENGGIENESLFAYKKNMKSFQESKSTKELRTRIHFKKVIEAHEEGKKDQILTVTIDSQLINKYKHIYEADMEVQDQDVVDQKTLEEYGKRYFRETLCDMIEESLEIDVVGQADQPVHMFDIVSIFHESYDVDLRKKITKYKFNPMSNKLVSIGFGEVTRTLSDSISGMVNDSVDKKMKSYDAEYEAKVQKLIDNANAEYDKQAKELEHKITDGIEQAKSQAEVVKREINGIITQKISDSKKSTDLEIEKINLKAQEALDKAGTIPDTNQLSYQIKQQILNSTDLSRKVTETFNQTESGVIYNKIYQNIREEFTSKSDGDYLFAKAGLTNQKLDDIDNKIAKQTVEFNKLTESNKLYERILGTSETGAPDQLSRLVMSSQIFQTEVGKYVTDDNNLIVNSMTMDKNTLVGNNNPKASVSVNDGIFTIKAQGLTGYNWTGFSLPIYVKKVYHGETYTLGFKYRIREYPDVSFAFNIKNHGLNKTLTWANIGENRPPLNEWQEFQKTFSIQEDFAFGEDVNYPFYIFLSKNGWIEFKEPILVRGSNTGPYKPSQFDDAYKTANKTRELAEATRTQVTQLAGSYSIQNINSAGDLISGVNLGADGTNRFVGKLTHITGETQIDNAVIKSAMVDKLKTGNFESGSVTTQIIASNAVTADKLLVDSAMINKLVTNQAFIRELMAQKAFITQLASIDFSAERIKGGRLESNTGSLVFDLDNSAMNMLTDTAVIRRVFNNFPTQFIRYGTHIENGNRFSKTIIGSNRDGTENSGNRTFSGIEIYNSTNENVEDYTKFYADKLYLQHSEYKQGWIIQNAGKPRIAPLNGTTYSEMIASDFRMIYTADGNHRSVGTYLWDLLTCFGILQRYGWDLKNSAAQSHIGSVLSKYNYR